MIVKNILLGLAFVSCAGSHTDSMNSYLISEIEARMESLEKCPGMEESEIAPAELAKKTGELILISKDVENLRASVRLSNTYFEEIWDKAGLRKDEMMLLTTDMHTDEIQVRIHQNQLTLLNRLIFLHCRNLQPIVKAAQ